MRTNAEKLQALEAEFHTHNAIMARLDDVKGCLASYFYINGNYYYWSVTTLTHRELKNIAERENHEELLKLIHQYGKAAPTPGWDLHKVTNHYANTHILPDFIQELIATRCNDEELNAYTSYQGFGLTGQIVFFAKSTDAQKRTYIEKHGFLPKVQQMLRESKKQELIDLHIAKHGMYLDWEKQVINSDFETFKYHVDLHEFSVTAQQHMCEFANNEKISYYIQKYGLWLEAHPYLVTHCDDDILYQYIDIHRHFSLEGETALCKRENHDLIMHYIDKRCEASSFSLIDAFYKAGRLNYIEILACLKRGFSLDEISKMEIKLMRSDHYDEILEYISHNKPTPAAVIELLKTDHEKAISLYFEKWNK